MVRNILLLRWLGLRPFSPIISGQAGVILNGYEKAYRII